MKRADANDASLGNDSLSSQCNIKEAILGSDDGSMIKELRKSIAELYLKIKRCSKDVQATESYYIQHLETDEDREERKMIWEMDPRVILQYINISIDVIINLKFEDIEHKMLEKNGGARNDPNKSKRGLRQGGDELRASILQTVEQKVANSQRVNRKQGQDDLDEVI